MAGRGAPSFLKRQKEQKRAARAVAKRAAQQARRDDRAARAAAADEGVRITYEDRPGGTMRGESGSSSVLITLVTQADGSIRVGFTVSGASTQDSSLQDRLAASYQRHMGR
jgi:hypothetical protein